MSSCRAGSTKSEYIRSFHGIQCIGWDFALDFHTDNCMTGYNYDNTEIENSIANNVRFYLSKTMSFRALTEMEQGCSK